MKNLFVSFWHEGGEGNIVIPSDVKICDHNDVESLQEYIEMAHGLNKVLVKNFRRME